MTGKGGRDGAKIAWRAKIQRVFRGAIEGPGIVAGKMHLWRFDFGEKNSIFRSRYGRNNFLFTPLTSDIYRK
jgi:hypothetical protein